MSRVPRRLARAFAVLTWRHWAWAAALGAILGVMAPFMYFGSSMGWILDRMVFHTPWYLLFAFVFLLAIAWVDSKGGDSAPALWRYAAAAIGAGTLCVLTAASFSSLVVFSPLPQKEGYFHYGQPPAAREVRRRVRAATNPGLDSALYGFLATMIYARLRNARRMALSLSQAELARSEASRALLSTKLAAARATVDPGQVIEQLGAIARMYESDPASADAQLDRLIAFLRDAIPRLHERQGGDQEHSRSKSMA